MKTTSLLTILVISIFLISCLNITTQNKIGDGGLLTDNPCSPPCFLGIIPGSTTRDQAIKILAKKGFDKYEQKNDTLNFNDTIYLAYDSKEYVNLIEFSLSSTVEVRNIIEKYGYPNAAEVLYDIFSTPEDNYFDMGIYYDKLQTYIMLERQKVFPAYTLRETTKIKRVIYFDEASYKKAINNIKHITEWKGYGLYQDPAP
jgi:hypothetical protein